jgi:hypothetical protein
VLAVLEKTAAKRSILDEIRYLHLHSVLGFLELLKLLQDQRLLGALGPLSEALRVARRAHCPLKNAAENAKFL